jgi:2-aminoadipate transaminase
MTQSNPYNLSLGYPESIAMPSSTLSDLAAEIIGAGRGLQYGGDLYGPRFVRQEIAAFLRDKTQMTIEAESLVLTAGSVHGIDVVTRALTKPGDVVLVEGPTFFFVFNLFRMNQVELVSVPLCEYGIDLVELERLLKQYGSRVRILYTIPSYQNPTGICASAENRRALVMLAHQYDFTILEDTAYHFLYFDAPPPPMLNYYDGQLSGTPNQVANHVVTLGTFSKLVAPSLRQGWIWSTPENIAKFVANKSDAGASTLTSELLSEFLKRGEIDKHLVFLRDLYGRKCQRLADSMRQRLPDWVGWTQPGGGYFVWVTLPRSISATAVRMEALKQGVDFLPGQVCFPNQVEDNTIRLCFAYLDEALLEPGVAILGDILRRFQS